MHDRENKCCPCNELVKSHGNIHADLARHCPKTTGQHEFNQDD